MLAYVVSDRLSTDLQIEDRERESSVDDRGNGISGSGALAQVALVGDAIAGITDLATRTGAGAGI